ncbi:hypothetical protein PGTUg99_020793 [Puccinia graminis f. sp. tritici]|uniref:Uncharacterized protein n=1 Tax=Puccinia graminis f. sp. tritici TaxID=56615 RepID=A0A5B0RQJ0_PUCGR|nr:hypothetical protein PGTUg99_020793 [Puccinia graminis f. sp. tritici]
MGLEVRLACELINELNGLGRGERKREGTDGTWDLVTTITLLSSPRESESTRMARIVPQAQHIQLFRAEKEVCAECGCVSFKAVSRALYSKKFHTTDNST